MKWKAVKVQPIEERSYRIPVEKEELSGYVQGEPASDIEERLYRGLINNDVPDENIIFQPSFIAGRLLPGEVRPDFLVEGFGLMLIFYADGEYFHKTAAQRGKDQLNDARLMAFLEGKAQPPIRIPGAYLQDQETADMVVGEYV